MLSVKLTHQNNTVSGLNAIWNTLILSNSTLPNWPQVNAVINMAPYQDYDPKIPLTVYFDVETKIIAVNYKITTAALLFGLFSDLGSFTVLLYIILSLLMTSYGKF